MEFPQGNMRSSPLFDKMLSAELIHLKLLLWVLILAIPFCYFLPASYAQTGAADYALQNNWLCRGLESSLGACDVDLTATIVNADGSLTAEYAAVNPAAPIDCFYVYPTVSIDNSPNSDLIAGDEEFFVTRQQFARFGTQCLTYAPMYRQATRTAFQQADTELAYADVLDAWNYYLINLNRGRGVVLVGHSQGASVLKRLVTEEIDGKSTQVQILSAILLGTTVHVLEGELQFGTFVHMPLCASADQLQCIITFNTFRDTVPPSSNSIFGKNIPGTPAACTNPAELATNSNFLNAFLNGSSDGRTGYSGWTQNQPILDTPFAKVPGMLSAQCASTETHNYLEVVVHSDPTDPRTDDIAGDVIVDGVRSRDRGLHLIDVYVAMGDLLTIVARQSAVFAGLPPALGLELESDALIDVTATHYDTGVASNTFSVTDMVDINATLNIDQDDVGDEGLFYVVVRYNDVLYMKTTTSFIPIEPDLGNLVSFRPPVALQEIEIINVVSQLSGVAGELEIYVAYSNSAGLVRTNLDPLILQFQ